jgi:uncharacterized RDD family membrane protein YckC
MRINNLTKEAEIKSGEPKEGVYYAVNDYAGLLKRYFIIGVDLTVIYIFSLFVIVAFFDLPEKRELLIVSKLHVVFFISYIYLVIVKRSDWGTLGYILAGVRIVSLEGEKPPIWNMTLRFLLLIFGPVHFILDILYLSGDKYKQTLRDKIVGTYVIAQDAVPIGRGEQMYVSYFFFGWSIVFREVKMSSQQ